MRIEAYNQVHQLYQAKKVNQMREKSSAAQTDQLQFSDFGKEIRAAQAALSGSTNVNCLFFCRASSGVNGIVIGNHVFY